jgi:hypothetical protein
VDAVLSSLAGAPAKGFRLAARHRRLPELSRKEGVFTRPDFIFLSSEELLALELKIDETSGVDQFANYGIVAERFLAKHELKQARLVILAKTREFPRVLGSRTIVDEKALRELAVRAVGGEPGIWQNKGVPKYLSSATDEERVRLSERLKSMPLALSTFNDLMAALTKHTPPDPTAAKVIDGVVAELRRRGLAE